MKDNNKNDKRCTIDTASILQLRRAAIQTLRECDNALGYETVITRRKRKLEIGQKRS